jgi:hypothetical protein
MNKKNSFVSKNSNNKQNNIYANKMEIETLENSQKIKSKVSSIT